MLITLLIIAFIIMFIICACKIAAKCDCRLEETSNENNELL